MNILITGCAGFIGNAFALKLLKTSKDTKVIGLDNLDKFYSIKLKKKRLSLISKFSKNIVKKFKYFEEGKKIIEQSIKNDPNNIEIVFLRYLNQINSPWFLNYNQNLSEDRDFLNKNLNFISDPYFKNVIQKILKN